MLNNTAANVETNTDSDSSSAPAAQPAWVTKHDRHLQLINPAIFEKQSQERAKAIEETRKLKLKQKDDREKFKLSKHLARLDGDATSYNTTARAPQTYEVMVEGIRFQVMKDGSKLKRVDGDENSAKMTPKTATIGGVRFYRSKHGNLYRSGIVKGARYDLTAAHHLRTSIYEVTLTRCVDRKTAAVRKIDEPCRIFSTTGTFLLSTKSTGFIYTYDHGRHGSLILIVSQESVLRDPGAGICMTRLRWRFARSSSRKALAPLVTRAISPMT